MNRYVKRILASICCCSMVLPLAGCFTTDASEEMSDGNILTLETLQDWCDESGTAFLNAFKARDIDTMDDFIPNDMVNSFDNAYDEFFDVQSRKVWLDSFYVNYLEGAQVVSGTFLSDGQTVSMEYSIVIADYSTGTRNWLLLYDVTLYYGVDIDNEIADILNPEVVFDLYEDMSNDYTTHVAATLLDVTDDFDISNYYYDEDLGLYIDRRTVGQETDETEESLTSEELESVEEVPAETVAPEEIPEETT